MSNFLPVSALGAAALLLVATVSATAQSPAPKTTMSGIYTTDQAETGKTLYDGACAVCHGPTLRGSYEAPPLTGRLMANLTGRSVGSLHGYLQKAMPLFAPGSLSAEDNAAILAYILQTNGYPAGPSPLPADADALGRIAVAPLTPAQLAAQKTTGVSK